MAESIPKQMKAAVVKDFGKGYEVRTMDVPTELGPNDILVKIGAAGYCHTDLQVMEGVYESAGAKPGLVGSHEPAGTVVKAGSDAGKSGINVGDRVGSINTFQFCGECDMCKFQGQQLCEKLTGMLGLTVNGGFAEYMKADARVVSKIPESISFAEAAPLFCAGATVYGALLRANPQPGEWVAMVGIGGLGHLGVQYAKAMGCKVIAIDNRKEGIETAKAVPSHLRPDKTFVVDTEDAEKKCIEELQSAFYDSNPGVDRVVINAEARPLVRFSQQFLRKGGTLVDVGLPADGPLEVDAFALNFKEQTVRGRLICTPQECQDMINLHAKNGCKTHIEQTYTVDQMNEMFDRYQQKDLRGRLCMVFSDGIKRRRSVVSKLCGAGQRSPEAKPKGIVNIITTQHRCADRHETSLRLRERTKKKKKTMQIPSDVSRRARQAVVSYVSSLSPALLGRLRNGTRVLLVLLLARLINGRLNKWATNNWRVSAQAGWRWKNEVAVVTGGCSGIGLKLVQRLARHGVRVAVLDPKDMPAFMSARYAHVRHYACDVTSADSVAAAALRIPADLGGHPTILVNNAGISRVAPVLEASQADVRQTFEVNCVAHWITAQQFVPHMVRAGKGHVVTVASVASFVSLPFAGCYSATKAAALAFHEALTTELRHVARAPGVVTTIVHPTIVRTPLVHRELGFLEKSGTPMLTSDDVADDIFDQLVRRRGGQIFIPSKYSRFAGLRGWPSWAQEAYRDMIGRTTTR